MMDLTYKHTKMFSVEAFFTTVVVKFYIKGIMHKGKSMNTTLTIHVYN